MVFHDKENELILPVFEFFTTANDARTISTYLVQIKLALLNKIPKTKSFQIAPIIVTDFCWGLINAIMTTFNNCSADTYINWCYEILFNDSSYANVMKTIFVLCAVHFLKMVTKRVRKIIVYEDKIKDKKLQNAFIFTFTLLQNATSIEDFSRNIKHAYNIFCLKYESLQCLSSKNEIDNQLMKRNLTMLTIAEKDDDKKNIFKKFKANQNILILDNDFKESNLKMSSPFKIYFDKLINKHSQNIKMKLKNNNEKKENFFFCPQLFVILTDYTYILPFWTGIIIRYWKSINPNFESHVKDRIDNNYVENWFGQLNSVCSDMPVMPSVYTSRMYARIEAQFIDKYKYQNSDLKLNKTKDSLDEKEGWASGTVPKVPKKRRDNFYDKTSRNIFNNVLFEMKSGEMSLILII